MNLEKNLQDFLYITLINQYKLIKSYLVMFNFNLNSFHI